MPTNTPRLFFNFSRTSRILLLVLAAMLIIVACNDNSNSNGSAPVVQIPTPPPDVVSDSAIKLLVQESGIYKISLGDLQSAGIDVAALDAAQLELTENGVPVPYVIRDDTLLFYGQASDSRYSLIRPYVLRSGQPGTLMQTVENDMSGAEITSIAQTIRVENNWHYDQRAAEAQGDVWFWHRLSSAGKDAVLEFDIELPAVNAGEAALQLSFWGLTYNAEADPDHDVDVSINETPVGTITYDGQTYFTSNTPIDSSLLIPGRNRIKLDNSVPGNVRIDQMFFNWIALNYNAPTTAVNNELAFDAVDGVVVADGFDSAPLVLDVTDAGTPLQISNATFSDGVTRFGSSADTSLIAADSAGYRSPLAIVPLIDTDLRETSNQADLLIVTTRALAPELDPLVAARQEQGLSVKVTFIDELYDEFGGGAVSPSAIQNFVTYASENWAEPAPKYLFLVGDTTTDMLGFSASRPNNPIAQPTNLIPAPIVAVSHGGETVSDARLADVDGDHKPDLAVGRWPVDDARDVRKLVERTLAYETGVVGERALFTFDGSSNEFLAFTNSMIAASNFPESEATLFNGPTTEQIASEWNQGAWLVSYVGHGSLDMWGAADLMSTDSFSQISSADTAPPIVLQFSCLTGQFAYPESDSISEVMLKKDDGPVLLVASSSLTLSTHQAPFAKVFLAELQNANTPRIGDALQLAKTALQTENNSGLQEISDTFGLIGDPSTLILRPDNFIQAQSQ